MHKTTNNQNAPETHNHHIWHLWHWLIIVLILLGAPAAVWWWQQQNVSSLDAKVKDLNTQVEDLKAQPSSQPSSQQPAPAKYTAQVGKFVLSLEDTYGIVVLHDDGWEGAPLTKLLIVEQTPAPGVVKSNLGSKVEVTAIEGRLKNTTFAKVVAEQLEDSMATKLPNITIDGMTAEVYTVPGFDMGKRVFFAKGDTLYTIDLIFVSDQTEKMLEAVIKGFTFA